MGSLLPPRSENAFLRRAKTAVRSHLSDFQASRIRHGCYVFTRNPEELEKVFEGQRLAFGSRMHGAIAALNEGLATSVTNNDSRTREMAKLIGLRRFLRNSDLERMTLESLFQETSRRIDPKHFATASTNYWNFLLRAGLTCPDQPEMIEPNKEGRHRGESSANLS